VNGLPYTITLIKGNYNANTLKEHLYNLLISQTYPNGNDNKFNITYDIKTNKYIFSHLHHEFGFYESSNKNIKDEDGEENVDKSNIKSNDQGELHEDDFLNIIQKMKSLKNE
jgi:hypothetical protein